MRWILIVALLFICPSAFAQLAILDSYERVEYTTGSDWETTVSVKLSKNEPVGYVIRLLNDDDMPTGNFTSLYKMVPINVVVPSYSGGQTGTFYDAMVPLLSSNLSGTNYIYAEYVAPGTAGPQTVTLTQSATTVTLNVNVIDHTLTTNAVKFHVAIGNSNVWTGHHGSYQAPAEVLGLSYSQMAIDHRITPYGTYVFLNIPIQGNRLNYDDGSLNFRDYVLDFVPQNFMMPYYQAGQAYAEAAEVSVTEDSQAAWFYTMDEPSEARREELETLLTLQGTYAPSIKRMVTINKEFAPDPEPDIYCPVVDWFNLPGFTGESDYSSDELWLYTSCMEHGCGSNRNGNTGAPLDGPGTASGTAGLVLDHPTAFIYAFILLPMKYTTVKGLLYYHAVEGYQLYNDSPQVDVWTDQFNFGGNGDGTLFYPLRPGMYGATEHAPAPSMRMKKIRDAMYLLDYVGMAGAGNVTACGGGALITDPDTWEHSASAWESFRNCLVNVFDQSTGSLRTPLIQTTDTVASFTIGKSTPPALLYESDCTATIKTSPGGATVETITSSDGLAIRRLDSTVALTASTNYTVEQNCVGASVDSSLYAFTTKATPAGGNRTVPIQIAAAPTYSGIARASVQYDDNAALSTPTTVQNTDCAGACTINLTLAAGRYWYRVIRQTAGDVTVAVGGVQPLSVP